MQDPRFKETVIVMLYHNHEEGAAGLVINKPIETMFISELFKNSNIVPPKKLVEKEIIIYWGGPGNPEHIFFIHSFLKPISNKTFSAFFFVHLISFVILFSSYFSLSSNIET